jgi:Protein of unknown function (DUF2934)
MQDLDQAIRERAYHLWIAAGSPEGNADAYWLDAQRELLAGSLVVSEPAGPAEAPTRKKSAAKPKAPAKSKSKAA